MPNTKMRFLIVDDMANMRRTIRNMLRHLGYVHFEEADYGVSALDKLKHHKIDFVIADWNMPEMTGIELLRLARKDDRLKDIPFLMVTAEIAEETVAEAAETEVDGYIIKPFVARTLQEKIEKILEHRANPTELDSLLQAAQSDAEAGHLDKALSRYEKALELKPRSARVLEGIGKVYEQMGKKAEAEEKYLEAINLNPQYVKGYQTLADYFEKSGKRDRARESLERAVKISPRNPDRQTALGHLYLKEGKGDLARQAFSKAVDVDPRNVDRRMQIGEAFLEAGMAEEAGNAFQEALKLRPQDVHIYNRLGIAFRKQGRYQDAINEYWKALPVDPEDEVLHYNVGRAYLEAGEKHKAAAEFRKALELEPKFKEARDILSTVETEEKAAAHAS
ncbi:MAG: tetratricopeptide repeat protein [Candidatus Tectomicrobia bacterium]|uniref:Tetratricopeptide repeat protein n=1 Tax=Tectimicrobiota bacterium TaxID=2528274 RepID=A0A932LZH8_UNCTE|nr:tetratricopeptide repeat protein [Candidatus Tectomicrobia bacterium]